jgi:FMN-dependent NADH-azoreductase
MSGARYEIAIDGTTRTYRDGEELACEAAAYLKQLNPNSEITLRDLQTSAVTKIDHPSSGRPAAGK